MTCPGWSKQVLRFTGVDRAILFTVSARLLQVVGSVVTVLLIIHFLSPVEQGYYYTLLSLAALQVIFELGFSFVILQLAAHEAALLTIDGDGGIEGNPVSHARLASVLQLTVRWYACAAVALVVIVLPIGFFFFSQQTHRGPQASWGGPWTAAVLAVSLTFFLTPLFSFIEGCNQVSQVACLRMLQALVVLAVSWGAIATGHGLYACAMVNAGWSLMGIAFLVRRKRLLKSLLSLPVGQNQVCWRTEIWPFQWKTAVSWLCSYFTLQLFTPILFSFRGPQEAGRMGLSISIVGYLPIVALCWITTKAAPFGRLIKLGRMEELDSLFRSALRKSIGLVLLLFVLCLVSIVGVHVLFSEIALRMVSPSIFLLLLLAAVSSFIIQALAVYLRSFKCEPYLCQSTVVASLTVLGTVLTVSRWGSLGVALTYLLSTGVVGLPWAIAIYMRRHRLHAATESTSAGAADCAIAICAPAGGALFPCAEEGRAE